jgi:hypothetical protein
MAKKRQLPKSIRHLLKAYTKAVSNNASAPFLLGYDQTDFARIAREFDAAAAALTDEIHLKLEGVKYAAREERIKRYTHLLEIGVNMDTQLSVATFVTCCNLLLVALIYDVSGIKHDDIRDMFSRYFGQLVSLRLAVQTVPETLQQNMPELKAIHRQVLAFIH